MDTFVRPLDCDCPRPPFSHPSNFCPGINSPLCKYLSVSNSTGHKQTWEIGRFSMKTRRCVGVYNVSLMNFHTLNGESTPNILLNEAV